MAFQIDGGAVKDPIRFEYEERFTPFKNEFGLMVVSAYWSAIAHFNTLSLANFNQWSVEGDESTHSIVCPSPLNPSTYSTFTGVYIEYLGAEISTGLYFYQAQFRVRRIQTLGLTAFGA